MTKISLDKIKILILEDNMYDRELIEDALRDDGLSFSSLWVNTKEEFIEGLQSFNPDIVLSDHALPCFNSIEALKICKATNSHAGFILVTGTVSEEFAVDCLKQGVDDYLLKSNLSRLPSAVKAVLKQQKLERIRKAAQRALNHKNKRLLEINQELDSFVYSISHNLRAPISSAMGLLELAKGENMEKGSTLEKYHDMIGFSLRKLDQTLREILEYSRNERMDLAEDEVDFKMLIEENFKRLMYLPGADKITYEVLIDDNVCLYSDQYRVSMILENLVSNSIKYADFTKEQSWIHIYISGNSQKTVIHFSDNGIGIAENELGQIFKMFYRATDRGDGAGLGLYIIKQVVERLSGEIELFSTPYEGTEFRITIPNKKRKSGTTSFDKQPSSPKDMETPST